MHTYVHSHSAHNSQCINGWTTYKKYGQTAILFSISFTLTLIPFSIFPFDFVNRDAHKNASHPAKLRKQPFNWLWQFAQHPRCNFMSLHALYPIHNQNVIDLVLCIFFLGPSIPSFYTLFATAFLFPIAVFVVFCWYLSGHLRVIQSINNKLRWDGSTSIFPLVEQEISKRHCRMRWK